MVIVKLIGGLGNQMFQYAAGQSLAQKHNTTLKLDDSGFHQYPNRSYSLNHLGIREEFATPNELFCYTGKPQTKTQEFLCHFAELWKRFCREIPCLKLPSFFTLPPLSPKVYSEPHFHFDTNFFQLPADVYLDGYWQSEKYFKDIEKTIRQEFAVKIPITGQNLEITSAINRTESVSLHIRRGDYVNNEKTNAVHGTCGLEYYLACIKQASQTVSNAHFFAFSDDPRWMMENLRIDHPLTYVVHNNISEAHEDLRLMSLCRHNIVANSSFSWWAAWLNKNPDKIVFAPQEWFKKEGVNTKDLIPPDWKKI
ncbi:MAG: alpha-1,2-fucosyltransferase [Deltaproteobacteria bacterium]|nr:MAG: alpha-1,2-fucosyltransferase [Deltaproteobacteria bacterium]